ncbi:MAG: EamA family transporter [bacterium]
MNESHTGPRQALAGRDLPLAGLFYLFVIYLVWGSTYLAIRVAVRGEGGFEPFTLGALRLLPASLILLMIARFRRSRLRPTRSEFITLTLSGLLLWIGGNGLVNWAEQRADSGYTALIVGALPMWTALYEAILDRRTPSMRLAGGLLVGFMGLGVLTYPEIHGGHHADALSVLALLAAPMFWGMGMILMARRPVKLGSMAIAGWQQLIGFVGFVIMLTLTGEKWHTPTAAAWGGWAYLVVAGSLIAFTSFMKVLKLLPTSIVSTYAYVNPVIAVFLGWLILRESLTFNTLVGATLVLLGVAGVFDDRRHRQRQALTLKQQTETCSEV